MTLTADPMVDLDIDLDAVVPCNLIADDNCPNAAEWRLRLRHPDGTRCGGTNACTPHRIKADHLANAVGALIECARHDVVGCRLEWSPL